MSDDVSILGIKVDSTQVKTATKDLDKLTDASIKTEKATDKIGKTSKKTSGETSNYTKKTKKATKASDDLVKSTRQLKNALWALGVGVVANMIRGLSDEAVQVENKLRQVTSTTEQLVARFNDLHAIANDSRSSLSSNVVLYQRLVLATGELNLSQERLLGITSTISKAMTLSGATTAEAAGAIRQLSQGLGAGALRGDEFNSVAEQAPIIMRAIANETKMAIGDLRDFAATGGITAQIVTDSIEAMKEDVDKAFSETTVTFSEKITIIENDLLKWATGNEQLSGTVGGVGDALIALLPVLTSFGDFVVTAISGWVQFGGAVSGAANGMGIMGDVLDWVIITVGAFEKVLLSLIQVAFTPVAVGLNNLINLYDVLSNTMLEGRALIAEYILLDEKAAQALRDRKTVLTSTVERMAAYHQAFKDGRASIDDSVESLTKADKITMQLNFTNEKAALLAKKRDADALKLSIAVGKVNDALKEELAILKRTDREQALYTALKQAGTSANADHVASITANVNALHDEIEAQENAKTATKELAAAQKKAAKEAEKNYQKTHKVVSGFFVDMVDNGKNAFEDLADLFKKMLTKMVADMAASKLLQIFGITGGAAGFSGMASASGGAGGISSLLSAGGGISSLFSAGGALGGIGSFFTSGGTGAAGSAIAGADLAGAASDFTLAVDRLNTATSGFSNAVTQAAPWASALAGALDGFSQSGIKGALSGGAGGFFGAKGGAALGASIAGPIGAAVGAVLGGFLGGSVGASIFGGKWETKNSGLSLGVDGGSLTGSTFEDQKKKGGLFKSTKTRTVTTQLEAETLSGFNDALTGIKDNIVSAYGAIGGELGENVFKGFSSAAEKISTKGKTEEEINTIVTEYFGKLNAEMTAFVTGGLLTFDELVAVGQARAGLIDMFISDEQRISDNIESLNAAFASIGQEIPTTDAAMVSLVKSLDLTTAAGLEQFAVLSQLGGATKEYIAYMNQLKDATEAAQVNTVKAATDAAFNGLRKSIEAEKSLLQSAFDADISVMEARLSGVTTNVKSLTALVTSVERAIAPMTRAQGQAQLRGALDGGSLAGVDLSGALAAIAKPSAQLFSSFEEYQRDLQLTNNALVELQTKAKGQLSTEERIQAGIELQIAQRESQFNEESASWDLQLQIAQDQLDSIRGLDISVQGMWASLRDFNAALGNESAVTGGTASISGQTAAGITAQVEEFYNTILGRDADASGLAFYSNIISSGTRSAAQVRREIAASEEAQNIPAFASGGSHKGGLRIVGENGPELEATGASTITSNSNLQKLLGNGELLAEVKQLRADNRQVGFKLVEAQRQMNKLMQRWDGDGMPEERTA